MVRKEILSNHTSIWLSWNSKILVNRIKDSIKRPLAINYKNQIIDLIKRSNIYSKALYKINCDDLSKDEIVNKVINIYETN